MTLIHETKHFFVELPRGGKPLVTRSDGGHIIINPRVAVVDVQQLTPKQAIELMRLMIVVGQAMATVMNKQGVDIGRVNYQDSGNWGVFNHKGPHLHYHLFGRAKSAVIQRYGQALYFPHIEEKPAFYENNEPLNNRDIQEIREEIGKLMKEEKYQDSRWGLSA